MISYHYSPAVGSSLMITLSDLKSVIYYLFSFCLVLFRELVLFSVVCFLSLIPAHIFVISSPLLNLGSLHFAVGFLRWKLFRSPMFLSSFGLSIFFSILLYRLF